MNHSFQSIVRSCCEHCGSCCEHCGSQSNQHNEQHNDGVMQKKVAKERCSSKERHLQEQRTSISSQKVAILDESKTKNSKTHELEVNLEMHNISSSCGWRASRYRRNSFEWRGAMSHLLLNIYHQDVDRTCAAQVSPLLINDASYYAGKKLHQERLAKTPHDRCIFDPEQLRKERDRERSLDLKWPKKEPDFDRRRTMVPFAQSLSFESTETDFLPHSEDDKKKCFDGSTMSLLNSDYSNSQQLSRGIIDVNSPFYPIRRLQKARSAPELYSDERFNTLLRNKVPKKLREELANPVFKRMDQSGELLSNAVHSSHRHMK